MTTLYDKESTRENIEWITTPLKPHEEGEYNSIDPNALETLVYILKRLPPSIPDCGMTLHPEGMPTMMWWEYKYGVYIHLGGQEYSRWDGERWSKCVCGINNVNFCSRAKAREQKCN